MPVLKGLRVEVYRPAGYPDCTNGGVSGKCNTLTVVGTKYFGGPVEPLDKGSQVFEANDDAPAVVLVNSPRICLVPLTYIQDGKPTGHVGPMDGGNGAGTTDSRWSELGELFGRRLDIVPVHDRIETQEQYNALSI